MCNLCDKMNVGGESMKKFLLLIFFLFISLISVNEVKAGVLEDPYSTFATFQIAWHDDGDKLGFRPDEVTLKYEDLVNIKHSYEITFTKENVEVIKVNDEITIWSRRVPVYKDPQDGMRIRYTENFRSNRYSYPLGSSDVMTLEDKTLTTDFYILPYKIITYTEHWDDGGARDYERYSELEMTANEKKGKFYHLNCMKGEYIDSNTCQQEFYIDDAYQYDENGNPMLDKPYTFNYKMSSVINDFDYDIKVDDEGNVDVYISHEPYKIEDSKVTVNWNGNSLDSINLKLYNHDVLEQTIKITKEDDWSKVITNLYKNYKHGKASNYILKMDNIDNYEYEITGNIKDGFNVNITYIEKETNNDENNNEDNNENYNENNNKNGSNEKHIIKDTNNPKTNDNIICFILIFIISLIGILISKYKIRRYSE